MPNKYKKILDLDDLYNFYSTHKRSSHFSAEKSGYQLAVQIPATFESVEYEDDTLLYCKGRLFHTGLNRNHSSVTEDAAKKAMQTLAYKPVLANFCEYVDPDTNEMVKDFTLHDMIFDDDGNITYFEHQIGCITADEPYFEYDKELDKTYICATCAIPTEYTDAVNIIKRKGGTKVSVELLINDMIFDASTKTLELTDVIVQGVTCLGTSLDCDDNPVPVEEGMLGSRLDIKDFSKSNNSMFSKISNEESSKLIETLEKLNTTLANFNIQENHRKEDKYVGTEVNEVITTETEEVTEVESTVVENNEVVEDNTEVETTEVESTEESTVVDENESETNDKTPDVVENEEVEEVETTNVTETENVEDESVVENASENDETTIDENTIVENEKCKKKNDEEKFSKIFSISHEDIRCALYTLLEKYEYEQNDYFYIVSVYDDFFIYQSWVSGNYYCQKYVKNEDDTIAFDGNHYDLFAEFLTTEEKAALETMRSNYSSIQTELNAYKEAEEIADKMTVFEDNAYSAYFNTDEFKNLMSVETVKQFSKEELIEKADAALGKVVKATKTFAMNAPKEEEKKPLFFAFAKQEQSSFLDGLLKK